MNKIGSVNISNLDLRENFKVAAVMLSIANNVPIEKIDLRKLTQSYLRTMIDAVINLQVLQFPIITTDTGNFQGAPQNPLMALINTTDSIVCGQCGFYLLLYQFIGTQQSPDFGGASTFEPISYPSPWVTNGTAPALDPGVMLFWWGYMSVQINTDVLYKKWNLLQHMKQPATQSTPTLAQARPGSFTNAFAQVPGDTSVPWQPAVRNALDMGNDIFYPMEPLPVFSGTRQNEVKINLPSNIPSTIAPFNQGGIGYGTTFVLKLVLEFRGVLAMDSTSNK